MTYVHSTIGNHITIGDKISSFGDFTMRRTSVTDKKLEKPVTVYG